MWKYIHIPAKNLQTLARAGIAKNHIIQLGTDNRVARKECILA